MAENVTITRAEVITLKRDSQDVLREFTTDKGGVILSWKVQTRVNDKADNSPRLFRSCSMFLNSEEDANKIRDMIKLGSVLEVKGQTNRKSFKGNDGNTVYYDEIRAEEVTAIQVGEDQSRDLPF